MQNISAEDFFKPTNFNNTTKNQLWMSIIADSHDSLCNCWHPFAHMLASLFPPGHQDRNKTIEQILQRDFAETCHSGGEEGESSGAAGGGNPDTTNIKEEENQEEDIDALMAAAAAATEKEDTR
nr:MAG: hypothetical protein [Gammatorquevirus sp.]